MANKIRQVEIYDDGTYIISFPMEGVAYHGEQCKSEMNVTHNPRYIHTAGQRVTGMVNDGDLNFDLQGKFVSVGQK